MTAQYLRSLSLVVADSSGEGIDLSNLRVRFHVRRGDTQTPNSMNARVYNLSAATAAQIENEFTQIVLQAGYGDNLSLVFRGVITQTRHGRVDQRDSYVDITAADGDEAYNYSPMAISLAAGARPQDVVQAVLKSMATPALGKLPANQQPITQGYTAAVPQNGSLRGKVLFGLARDVMRKLADTHDLKWSIQEGQLTVIQNGSYIPGDPVLITPSTGLIGVPETTENGLSMRVLLNPDIKIGSLVKLDSTDVNQYRYGLDKNSQVANAFLAATSTKLSADGTYYVMRADHLGDTRGDEWYTELTCLATDISVPAKALPYQAVGPMPVARY